MGHTEYKIQSQASSDMPQTKRHKTIVPGLTYKIKFKFTYKIK